MIFFPCIRKILARLDCILFGFIYYINITEADGGEALNHCEIECVINALCLFFGRKQA